jgi:hypothetical protein
MLLTRRLATLRSEQRQADVAGLLVLGGAFVAAWLPACTASCAAPVGWRTRSGGFRRVRSSCKRRLRLQDPIFVLDAGRRCGME